MSGTMAPEALDDGQADADAAAVQPGSFAARLNRLFRTVYPPGRGPYMSLELVRALEARGLTLSAPYLSQLRSGRRDNPSFDTMYMIAEFFGIRSDYFTGRDAAYCARLEEELDWLDLVHDPGVRLLTTAVAGLTPRSRERFLAKAGI
jgi:transcriptional regulator with XRE-family HTH domain